jgi:hypothetical protein
VHIISNKRTEVYVRPFPDVNSGKWQVSTAGGSCPLWSPDGAELFYLSEDKFSMAVAFETNRTLRFGTPKLLFKNTNLGSVLFAGTPWDIHPDGKRFLMIQPPEPVSPEEGRSKPRITIVLNWTEELRQRVQAK